MADIFLSYAHEDSESAAAMIKAFESSEEWSVWYDRDIRPASTWSSVLENELERARCVVMLWSRHAIQSDWVRREGMAGLDRAVLVPVLVGEADIPEVFGAIQFADLTRWDGDPAALCFTALLQSIKSQMLPHCRIRFDSLLDPRHEDLENLYEAYLQISNRLGLIPAPNQFRPPSAPDEQQSLQRTVASLQISIEWDSSLANWFPTSTRRDTLVDSAQRIERHLPLIWLRLLAYSGPFFSSVSSPRSHANYLRFASLRFYHAMFRESQSRGSPIPPTPPLTDAQLSFPRWEGAISALFEDSDDIAEAYVTHFDDVALRPEEVFYGPKYRSQLAYGRSLRNCSFTEPLWLECYVVPQRELRLALEGSAESSVYGGNARIRKVVDLSGNDLPPLYE